MKIFRHTNGGLYVIHDVCNVRGRYRNHTPVLGTTEHINDTMATAKRLTPAYDYEGPIENLMRNPYGNAYV